jgi:hypothetical protein
MDLTPPASVAAVAAAALKMRDAEPDSNKCCTPTGLKRANQLKNRESLSPKTIRRMVNFFTRHEVDKKAEGFHKGEKGFPSKGRQAWDMWGGDEGRAWAEKMLAASEREQGVTEMIDVNVLTGADIRRIDGKYGKISKLSLPWVTVKWADGKEESFLRSDEALIEDIEMKTLDKGWIALGSVVGANSLRAEESAEPASLDAALAEIRFLRMEARIAPLRERLIAEAKKKASAKAKGLAAGAFAKKDAAPAEEPKKAEAPKAAAAKEAPKKPSKAVAKAKEVIKAKILAAAGKKKGKAAAMKGLKDDPEFQKAKEALKKDAMKIAKAAGLLKKPAKKKKGGKEAEKEGGKGGGGKGGSPNNPFSNYSTLGTNTKVPGHKRTKRSQTGYWKCKGNEQVQICKGSGGEVKTITMWPKKPDYVGKYERARAAGKSKLPDGSKKKVAHSRFTPSGAISDAEAAELEKKSQKKKASK